MPILGTIASSRLTAVAGDYELISKTTISSNTSSVTLSSIPQTYKHLLLYTILTNNEANDYAGIQMRVNGDSASTNYSEHYLQTNYDTGNVLSGGNNNSDFDFFYSAGTNNASRVGLNAFTFYDYTSTSKNKSFMTTSHFLNNGASSGLGQGFGGIYTGNFKSNSAITSLVMIHNGSANFASGSVFWLYGIRS